MNGMASSSMVTALKKRVAFLERDIVSLTQAMAGYEAELRIAETPERKRDLQRLIRSCCDSVTELQQVKKRVEEAGASSFTPLSLSEECIERLAEVMVTARDGGGGGGGGGIECLFHIPCRSAPHRDV